MDSKIDRFLKDNPFVMDILNSLPEAFYLRDEHKRTVFINTAGERLDGYTTEELYGKTEIRTYGLSADESPILLALNEKKEVNDFVCRYFANGKQQIQVCNAAPIFIDGEFAGAYTIQRDWSDLNSIIERNIDLQKELFAAGKSSADKKADEPIVLLGNDPMFTEAKSMALRAAQTDSSVMLIADTGCGKELFARYIHDNSSRKNGPFLALNCAAIPENLLESLLFGTAKGAYTGAVEKEGLFEQAKGGSLFLDELNSMPLSSQAKLLRVLEEKVVQHLGGTEQIKTDVRIISSSNIQVQEALSMKQLRPDLFYRLAVISICIPPLSQRREDIYTLANHFIATYNESFGKRVMGLDDEVVPFFLSFEWPGNVRQLKHCIESAMNFIADDEFNIKKKHLPPYILNQAVSNFTGYKTKELDYDYAGEEAPLGDAAPPAAVPAETIRIHDAVAQREKAEIIATLLECRGNLTQAAKKMNIGRYALMYRMKKYGIEK